MIDIDARLNAFNVILMGEPISFDEQVIYFQTKSILDVTKTLWQGQGFDLKLVGALVFSFSVVFPSPSWFFPHFIFSAIRLLQIASYRMSFSTLENGVWQMYSW